jgi:hypothetical protein
MIYIGRSANSTGGCRKPRPIEGLSLEYAIILYFEITKLQTSEIVRNISPNLDFAGGTRSDQTMHDAMLEKLRLESRHVTNFVEG